MKQKLERPILISLQLRIVGLADSTADSVIGATEAVTTMPPSEVRAYVLFFSYCAKLPFSQPYFFASIYKGGWFDSFVNFIEGSIKACDGGLMQLTGQKSYGISIVLFTLVLKGLTYPLTKAQLTSTTKMQAIQPMVFRSIVYPAL